MSIKSIERKGRELEMMGERGGWILSKSIYVGGSIYLYLCLCIGHLPKRPALLLNNTQCPRTAVYNCSTAPLSAAPPPKCSHQCFLVSGPRAHVSPGEPTLCSFPITSPQAGGPQLSPTKTRRNEMPCLAHY